MDSTTRGQTAGDDKRLLNGCHLNVSEINPKEKC